MPTINQSVSANGRDKFESICSQLPRTGIPILKMSPSNFSASAAYTEFGPPEIIIPL